MINQVLVTPEDINILWNHAKEVFPNECCCMLLGNIEGDKAIVKDVHISMNTDQATASFTISPEDLIETYHEAETRNMEIVAIFHSHPYWPAHPSNKDAQYMQLNPVPWIIYSNNQNRFRTWVLREEQIVQIELIVGSKVVV